MTEIFTPPAFDRGARASRAPAVPRLGMPLPPVAGVPAGLRSGPSRRATEALLLRALAAVDTRLVGQLSALPADLGGNGRQALQPEDAAARLELALLRRTDRMLRHQLSSLSDDVVLSDAQAELADGVHALLADLSGDAALRNERLLGFLREILAEVTAHRSSQAASLKQRLQKLRGQGTPPPAGAAATRQLAQWMLHAQKLYGDLHRELERLCPRGSQDLFDQLLQPTPPR